MIIEYGNGKRFPGRKVKTAYTFLYLNVRVCMPRRFRDFMDESPPYGTGQALLLKSKRSEANENKPFEPHDRRRQPSFLRSNDPFAETATESRAGRAIRNTLSLCTDTARSFVSSTMHSLPAGSARACIQYITQSGMRARIVQVCDACVQYNFYVICVTRIFTR